MLSSNIIYGAGILFYSKSIDKSVYFFLGKDNDNKWSNFGGRCELSDKQDHEVTAARETWEESLGCIEDYDFIKNTIRKTCSNTNVLYCKTPSGYPYYLYLVKLPYNTSYRYKFHSTKKFISRVNLDKKFEEISDVKWVSYDTLKYSIGSRSPFIRLRGVFEQTLKEKRREIDNIITS